MVKIGSKIIAQLIFGLIIANQLFATTQDIVDIAVQSDVLFGYDDILIISLVDYSPSGTYIKVTGNVVMPSYYDLDEIPRSFVKASELESGTRVPIFGASAIGGRHVTTIFTGADSRFSFGIIGGRSNIPHLSLDGIPLNIASCLGPKATGVALHISDDTYISGLKRKELYLYPDAKFLPGEHSFRHLSRIKYDSNHNDYRCTQRKRT